MSHVHMDEFEAGRIAESTQQRRMGFPAEIVLCGECRTAVQTILRGTGKSEAPHWIFDVARHATNYRKGEAIIVAEGLDRSDQNILTARMELSQKRVDAELVRAQAIAEKAGQHLSAYPAALQQLPPPKWALEVKKNIESMAEESAVTMYLMALLGEIQVIRAESQS